jgi:hypothetical protein
MPILIENKDSGQGVVFVGKDTVSGQDIIDANTKILTFKEGMKNSKYCIVDYSNITEYEVSTSEIKIIASQDKEVALYLPDYIVAIVAKENHEFGVSRMWEAIIEINGLNWETMVFRGRDDAEQWIKTKIKNKYGSEVTI